MGAMTKTISVCVHNEDLEGIVSLEEPSNGPGVLYTASRSSATKLPGTTACTGHGIYLLLSQDRVLVGQTKSLVSNLHRHMDEEPWWTIIAAVTTIDNSLSADDAAYLERILANKATALGRLVSKGGPSTSTHAEPARHEQLEAFMEWTLFLLELRGIHTFRSYPQIPQAQSQAASSIRPPSGEKLGKSDALEYIRSHGINVGTSHDVTFAKLQPKSGQFWANPNTRLLQTNWYIILNDTQRFELVILHVPARSVTLRRDGKDGLLCRSDKPMQVDLNIDRDSLIDHRSGAHFSRFVINRIPY